MQDGDAILIVWILSSFLWDVFVFAGIGYLVFWRGHSGWWFLFAALLTYTPNLFKALRKRFALPEED